MARDMIDGPATAKPGGVKPDWAMSGRERETAARARAGLPPRGRPWLWLVTLPALAAGGSLGYLEWDERRAEALATADAATAAEAAATAAGPAPRQVNGDEWATLAPQDLRRTVRVIGTLTPARRADLAAEASGQVEAVLARPGDRVAEGQVLAQVDVQRLTIDLNLARSNADATRAQVALAEGQLARARELVDRGVQAASTLEEAESSVAALRANLAALDDQVAAAGLSLDGATVRAPFEGVVSSRAVDPGAVVSAGTPLLSLVDLSRIEMVAQAPVSAGALLEAGQAVEVEVDGIAGRRFPGTVARIAPVATEGTRTLPVYVRLDNMGGPLLGGMFATGEIVVAEALGAIAVPTAALREDDDGSHVLVIEDGRLARRAVEPGEAWAGDVTEIAEGLATGDAVVTAALTDLAAGEAVEMVEF